MARCVCVLVYLPLERERSERAGKSFPERGTRSTVYTQIRHCHRRSASVANAAVAAEVFEAVSGPNSSLSPVSVA